MGVDLMSRVGVQFGITVMADQFIDIIGIFHYNMGMQEG